MACKTARIVCSLFVLAFWHASPGQAQEVFPNRQLQMIVPFAPGAATDVVARIVADGLAREAGHEVVVLNQPGANGLIALNKARSQPADGHVVLFLAPSIVVDQAMKKSPPIDVRKDIVPVARAIQAPLGLFVSKQTPVNSLRELVAYLKANPGKHNFATSGVGSFAHLNTELFLLATGTKAAHIPYPAGTGAIVTAMIAGDATIFINEMGSMYPFVADGRIKVLATLGDRRSPLYPDAPAVSEIDIPELREAFLPVFFGLYTTPGTPAGRVEALAVLVNKTLAQPETINRLQKMGYAKEQLGRTSPAEFRRVVDGALAKFQAVIGDAKIEKQ